MEGQHDPRRIFGRYTFIVGLSVSHIYQFTITSIGDVAASPKIECSIRNINKDLITVIAEAIKTQFEIAPV